MGCCESKTAVEQIHIPCEDPVQQLQHPTKLPASSSKQSKDAKQLWRQSRMVFEQAYLQSLAERYADAIKELPDISANTWRAAAAKVKDSRDLDSDSACLRFIVNLLVDVRSLATNASPVTVMAAAVRSRIIAQTHSVQDVVDIICAVQAALHSLLQPVCVAALCAYRVPFEGSDANDGKDDRQPQDIDSESELDEDEGSKDGLGSDHLWYGLCGAFYSAWGGDGLAAKVRAAVLKAMKTPGKRDTLMQLCMQTLFPTAKNPACGERDAVCLYIFLLALLVEYMAVCRHILEGLYVVDVRCTRLHVLEECLHRMNRYDWQGDRSSGGSPRLMAATFLSSLFPRVGRGDNSVIDVNSSVLSALGGGCKRQVFHHVFRGVSAESPNAQREWEVKVRRDNVMAVALPYICAQLGGDGAGGSQELKTHFGVPGSGRSTHIDKVPQASLINPKFMLENGRPDAGDGFGPRREFLNRIWQALCASRGEWVRLCRGEAVADIGSRRMVIVNEDAGFGEQIAEYLAEAEVRVGNDVLDSQMCGQIDTVSCDADGQLTLVLDRTLGKKLCEDDLTGVYVFVRRLLNPCFRQLSECQVHVPNSAHQMMAGAMGTVDAVPIAPLSGAGEVLSLFDDKAFLQRSRRYGSRHLFVMCGWLMGACLVNNVSLYGSGLHPVCFQLMLQCIRRKYPRMYKSRGDIAKRDMPIDLLTLWAHVDPAFVRNVTAVYEMSDDQLEEFLGMEGFDPEEAEFPKLAALQTLLCTHRSENDDTIRPLSSARSADSHRIVNETASLTSPHVLAAYDLAALDSGRKQVCWRCSSVADVYVSQTIRGYAHDEWQQLVEWMVDGFVGALGPHRIALIFDDLHFNGMDVSDALFDPYTPAIFGPGLCGTFSSAEAKWFVDLKGQSSLHCGRFPRSVLPSIDEYISNEDFAVGEVFLVNALVDESEDTGENLTTALLFAILDGRPLKNSVCVSFLEEHDLPIPKRMRKGGQFPLTSVKSWSPQLKQQFLWFFTGSLSPPAPRSAALRIEYPDISYSESESLKNIERLPRAHTCTHILELPTYASECVTVLQSDLAPRLLDRMGIPDAKELCQDSASLINSIARFMDGKLRLSVSITGDGYGLDDLTQTSGTTGFDGGSLGDSFVVGNNAHARALGETFLFDGGDDVKSLDDEPNPSTEPLSGQDQEVVSSALLGNRPPSQTPTSSGLNVGRSMLSVHSMLSAGMDESGLETRGDTPDVEQLVPTLAFKKPGGDWVLDMDSDEDTDHSDSLLAASSYKPRRLTHQVPTETGDDGGSTAPEVIRPTAAHVPRNLETILTGNTVEYSYKGFGGSGGMPDGDPEDVDALIRELGL